MATKTKAPKRKTAPKPAAAARKTKPKDTPPEPKVAQVAKVEITIDFDRQQWVVPTALPAKIVDALREAFSSVGLICPPLFAVQTGDAYGADVRSILTSQERGHAMLRGYNAASASRRATIEWIPPAKGGAA